MTTTVIDVQGMTCGNCVKHVTEELTGLTGVSSVEVDLNAGGISPVTVTSTDPLDEATLREAVDEAGYEVTAIR
ncbi:heavy-metal-associated domain-containing protein [Ruania albidiflava]|uniref:heavy-metal-associated domain-containing protein n=1 Tax=Ruania albidiflava TaxID=366586 RepID=UPI0003B48EA8|nr:heavy-metal-associated domain-containing protein [Ruania albidiflava]